MRKRARLVITNVLMLTLFASLLPLGPPAGAQTPGGITHVYDEAGRLVATIDPATETAIFAYDAVGNIDSITRRSSALTSIIEFTPNGAAVGDKVTIYGTAFGPAATDNTVTFNGTTATVTAATATKLEVTVPAGATTGRISVTAPSGTATSDTDFSVVGSNIPTISSVSPNIGVAGSSVTISGANFETTKTNDLVTFGNPLARVDTATSNSLGVTVPAGGASGRVVLRTPYGKATGPDFFVPPAPYVASDVITAGRMAIGDTQTVTVGSASKIGLVVFDAAAAQRLWMNLTNSTISFADIKLYGPDGQQVAAWTFGTGSGYFDLSSAIATAGTYMVSIDPSGTSTGGAVTLGLDALPADVTGTIAIDGAAQNITTTTPGQNGSLTFEGTAGQRISVNVTKTSAARAVVSIKNPDGTTLASMAGTHGDGFIDPVNLAQTGTYSIFFDGYLNNLVNHTATIYSVPPDITTTAVIGGPSQTVTT
ncbi:MAG: IPT/TIG domain-containing protein, partial [Actinomycetota bacterium]